MPYMAPKDAVIDAAPPVVVVAIVMEVEGEGKVSALEADVMLAGDFVLEEPFVVRVPEASASEKESVVAVTVGSMMMMTTPPPPPPEPRLRIAPPARVCAGPPCDSVMEASTIALLLVPAVPESLLTVAKVVAPSLAVSVRTA